MIYVLVSKIDIAKSSNPRQFLSSKDLVAYKEFYHNEDKMRMLASRILLDNLLQSIYPTSYNIKDLEKNENGKPYISGLKGISISHSNKLVAVAASRNNIIGIDVQKIGLLNIDDFDFELSYQEKQKYLTLPAKDKKHFLYDTWTMKESVVKADGMGISGMNQVRIDRAKKIASLNNNSWYFMKVPNIADYSISLCSNNIAADVIWLNSDKI